MKTNLRSIRKGLGIREEDRFGKQCKGDKKGLKDNNNQPLGIVNKFCIPFGTKSRIIFCGGLDSDCTVVTLHRTANFRVKHINSGIEKIRRGKILVVLLFIQPIYSYTVFQ